MQHKIEITDLLCLCWRVSEKRKWADLKWGHSRRLSSPAGCCKTLLWPLPASYRSRGPPARGRLSPDSASARGTETERNMSRSLPMLECAVQCSDAFSFALIWNGFNVSSNRLFVMRCWFSAVHTQNLNLTLASALKAYLLFREVVFDQAAHNLLRRPGCADMRGD